MEAEWDTNRLPLEVLLERPHRTGEVQGHKAVVNPAPGRVQNAPFGRVGRMREKLAQPPVRLQTVECRGRGSMPPKAPPKGKAMSKKELLDLLCVTLEKLREKAEATLEKAREERSLDHMSDAEDTLDKAMDALAAHGKIAPPVKKKRIMPLTDAIAAVRQQVDEARKAEQDHRRQERYEEWVQKEDETLAGERKALRPIAVQRVVECERRAPGMGT